MGNSDCSGTGRGMGFGTGTGMGMGMGTGRSIRKIPSMPILFSQIHVSFSFQTILRRIHTQL